ncbi:MAG: acyltransferase [Patescibacteria group bacterium]
MFDVIKNLGPEKINLLALLVISFFYLYFKRDTFKKLPKLTKEHLTKKPKQRIPFFDFAKGLAITAVVIIHATFFISLLSDQFPSSFLIWNESLNRLMRFAIPVFFISSGALLTLPDVSKIKNFYFKKAKAILPAYFFFSFLATFLTFGIKGPFSDYLFTAFYEFLTGTALTPYWFVPILIQFYILFPLIWYLLVVKESNPKKLLFVSFLISISAYFLMPYAGVLSLFVSALRFLFFFVLGIVLKPLFIDSDRDWLEDFGVVKYSSLIIISYFLIGAFNPTARFYNLRCFYGVAIALLLFFFYSGVNKFIKRLFEKLGQNTFYIYLFHFFPMYFSFYLLNSLSVSFSNPVWLVIGFTAVGLLTSWIFTLIASKLKAFIR